MLHAELVAPDLPQEAAMHLQIVWELRRVEVVGCCGHQEDVMLTIEVLNSVDH